MIWSVEIDLKQINEQGRDYSWSRPESCPRCSNWRVWGHGYVERYFDGFVEVLLLKCYRCPHCGCVLTARPATHFPRVRSSIKTIRSHLRQRLSSGRWPPSSLSRSRLRHWLANLKLQVSAHLTSAWDWGLLLGFDQLRYEGWVPVTQVR